MKLRIKLLCPLCDRTKTCPVEPKKKADTECDACGFALHTISDLGCPACTFDRHHLAPLFGEDDDSQVYADRLYRLRSTSLTA